MIITKEIYEAAWAKRDVATAEFKSQLGKDIAIAQTLPLGQQRKGAIKALYRYKEACKPAVAEWRRDLGI